MGFAEVSKLIYFFILTRFERMGCVVSEIFRMRALPSTGTVTKRFFLVIGSWCC